jgi:hypothetical protein
MKTGDVVKFVHPPGMGAGMDTTAWKQQSPGLIVGGKPPPIGLRMPTYEVLWKNGETTFEWQSYLEVISKA